jgi:hypothetical protein
MNKCDMDDVKPGKDLSKAGSTPHLDEVKPGKNLSKNSSSAAALAPAAPRPATSVGQANKELGGFKSIASSPTGPGARVAPMSARKFSVGAAGRVGNPAMHAVSGTIPNAKAEKNFGSARSPYGTGAAGPASQKNMPSNLKANMAPTAKGEMPVVNAEPEKSVKGAKAPKTGTDETAKKQGSGGEIKKGTKLAKAAPALAAKAPAGKGVPGRQPVGQGGGDAHKTASTAKLPTPAGTQGSNAVTKPVPGKLKAAGAADVGRMKGNANIADLRGKLADVAAAKAKPAHPDVAASLAGIKANKNKPAAAAPAGDVDVDVSDFDQGPAKAPGRLAPFRNEDGSVDQNGGAKMMQQSGGPAVKRAPMSVDKAVAQMKGGAQKQSGGVGFLRGLFSMFHSKQPQGQPTGKGMRPAPTASVDQAARQLGGNNGATTIPTDSTGGVRTLPAGTPTGQLKRAPMTRFHGALPLQRGELDMRKASLSLTKKDLEDDELDKMEPPPPTEGMIGTNHSRRMLSITPKRRRAKKNR